MTFNTWYCTQYKQVPQRWVVLQCKALHDALHGVAEPYLC